MGLVCAAAPIQPPTKRGLPTGLVWTMPLWARTGIILWVLLALLRVLLALLRVRLALLGMCLPRLRILLRLLGIPLWRPALRRRVSITAAR